MNMEHLNFINYEGKMKMTHIILLIIIMLGTFSSAKPILEIEATAKTFIQKGNAIEFKDESVAVNESSNKTYSELKYLLSTSFSIYASRKNSFRIKKENYRLDISMLETNRQLCAESILQQLMPQKFIGQFKLVSIDLLRSFSKSQGTKIEGYTFNFKRLYNNRIVRNNDNYLVVRTDENGYLRNAEIALQDFEMTSEHVIVDADYNEKVITLDSLLEADYNSLSVLDENKQLKKIRVEKIKVGSVADAYCEITIDAERKLIPCLSYASKIIFSNNDEIGVIVDAPYSRKSWDEYRQNNSFSFKRYRR